MAFHKNEDDRAGLLFVGCLFVGVGLGMLVSGLQQNWIYVGVGAVVGAGAGLLLHRY